MKEKYQNTAEYFDAYQVKETAAVKPFERQEHEPADEKERKKYEKYYYGRYKGENLEGVPHGLGKLQWDLPNSDLIQSTSGVRKLFRGQLQQGMLLSGYLEFYCKSFYIGDFNPTMNPAVSLASSLLGVTSALFDGLFGTKTFVSESLFLAKLAPRILAEVAVQLAGAALAAWFFRVLFPEDR